jgi:very-short-patch-repair endonuclease
MKKLSLAKVLKTRDLTDSIVEFFLRSTIDEEEKEGQERGDNPDDQAGWLEFLRSTLDIHYRRGVERVYRYAQSEIEKVFFNSLLLAFLKADPLNFFLVEPEKDALAAISEARNDANEMLKIDEAFRAKYGGHKGDGFRKYIDLVLESGEMNQEEHEWLWGQYVVLHHMGFAGAFHVMMQAKLPQIRVEGRSIRADALIYVLNDTSINIIVECDGFQYHSGKESFIADRKRDRELLMHGFKVWRVSGSEVHNDPAGVASQLFYYLQSLRSGQ